jgi:hypothetical protein
MCCCPLDSTAHCSCMTHTAYDCNMNNYKWASCEAYNYSSLNLKELLEEWNHRPVPLSYKFVSHLANIYEIWGDIFGSEIPLPIMTFKKFCQKFKSKVCVTVDLFYSTQIQRFWFCMARAAVRQMCAENMEVTIFNHLVTFHEITMVTCHSSCINMVTKWPLKTDLDKEQWNINFVNNWGTET